MTIQGALLKPSEKGERRRGVSRIVPLRSRYEVLKEGVHAWCNDKFKVGMALAEIQADKLYQEEYETFEVFCDTEYGLKRAHAYRMIDFAKVKDSVQRLPMGDTVQNERQARALATVPVAERGNVLAHAAKTGSVTAETITQSAQELGHAPNRWGPRATESNAKDYDEAEQRLTPPQFIYLYLRCKPSISPRVRFKAIDEAREMSSKELSGEIARMLDDEEVE